MPWILLTDGDRQFDLTELVGLLPLASGHDLVAGYRIDRQDGSRAGRRSRVELADAAELRLRGHGRRLRVQARPDRSIRRIELTSDGAMVSAELLARAVRDGWEIAEMGVHHRPRAAGEPSGGNASVVARAFRERRALLRELRRSERQGRAVPQGRLLHH